VLSSIFLSDWNERFPTTTKTALHVRCGFGNNFEKSDITNCRVYCVTLLIVCGVLYCRQITGKFIKRNCPCEDNSQTHKFYRETSTGWILVWPTSSLYHCETIASLQSINSTHLRM